MTQQLLVDSKEGMYLRPGLAKLHMLTHATATPLFTSDIMDSVESGAPGESAITGFLDLPPELRNTIYEYCLTAKRAIRIVVRESSLGSRLRYTHTPSTLGLSPLLLISCTQVHREATAVLYGTNTFSVGYAMYGDYGHHVGHSLAFFRGPRAQHIRTIELHDLPNRRVVEMFTTAVPALSKLDKLIITSDCIRNFKMPHTMASGLKSMIKAMHKQRKNTNQKQVQDIVVFRALTVRREKFMNEVQQHLAQAMK